MHASESGEEAARAVQPPNGATTSFTTLTLEKNTILHNYTQTHIVCINADVVR